MTGITSNSAYNNVFMNQQRPRGPKLDTNNDKAIDLNELESFSQKQAEKTGSSFDAQEVLSTYDSNEDGLIDKSEGSSMREDNALNMPSPEEMQAMMMSRGGNRPQGPPPGGKPDGMQGPPPGGKSGGVQGVDGTTTSSTDDLTAELLEALNDTDSTYTAAEIAEYDTNGDGTIDASEEAAMLAVSETEETASQDHAFQTAIDAYLKQSNEQYSTTAMNDAFQSLAV